MKRLSVIALLGVVLLAGLALLVPGFRNAVLGPAPRTALQDGDIIFQNSRSSQSEAIRRATHSPWTHMGLVIFRNGDPYVLEVTVAPGVTETSLLPMAVQAAGLDLGEVFGRLVSRAAARDA